MAEGNNPYDKDFESCCGLCAEAFCLGVILICCVLILFRMADEAEKLHDSIFNLLQKQLL